MDWFFGYGSLVNRATHCYPDARPARLAGWRRVWVQSGNRAAAYLSVEPARGAGILGLVARVPGGDWAALDLREAAYARHGVAVETVAGPMAAQVYAVPAAAARPAGAGHPLLLSYIDCVVQGFLREFGTAGAEDFFAGTAGWDAPVADDRARPRYPRACRLTDAERAAVDAGLAALAVQIVPLDAADDAPARAAPGG
jgi:hypothetical protein